MKIITLLMAALSLHYKKIEKSRVFIRNGGRVVLVEVVGWVREWLWFGGGFGRGEVGLRQKRCTQIKNYDTKYIQAIIELPAPLVGVAEVGC